MKSWFLIALGVYMTAIGPVFAQASNLLPVTIGNLHFNESGSLFLFTRNFDFMNRLITPWDVFYPPTNGLPANWQQKVEKQNDGFLISLTQNRPILAAHLERFTGPVRAMNFADGTVRFRASTCDILSSSATALAQFSSNTSEVDKSVCACRTQEKQQVCEIDVTNILTKFIKNNLGVIRSRANCFNTALVATGIMNEVREGTDRELITMLKSANCKMIQGKNQSGDIVVIFDPKQFDRQNVPVHAYVYLTEHLLFEKPNNGGEDPYWFASPQKVLNWYSASDARGAARFARTFRCPKRFSINF